MEVKSFTYVHEQNKPSFIPNSKVSHNMLKIYQEGNSQLSHLSMFTFVWCNGRVLNKKLASVMVRSLVIGKLIWIVTEKLEVVKAGHDINTDWQTLKI